MVRLFRHSLPRLRLGMPREYWADFPPGALGRMFWYSGKLVPYAVDMTQLFDKTHANIQMFSRHDRGVKSVISVFEM